MDLTTIYIPYGKHKGKSLKALVEEDRSKIKFMAECEFNEKDPVMRQAFHEAVVYGTRYWYGNQLPLFGATS